MGVKRYSPGHIAEASGIYRNTTTKHEVTVVKGEPFPPTPAKGQFYTLVEAAKHESKK